VIADTPQICKYLDMPIQHSEDAILTKMGRKGGKRELEQLIRVIRDRIPGISIRTTLMVGFPGETEEDFRGLYSFANEQEFDRMGVFPYSQEEGTPAAEMPNQIDEETKHERLHIIMNMQQKIHFKKQFRYVGKTLPVILDTQQGNHCTGRTQYDAYESDAVVEFTCEKQFHPGEIIPVRITTTEGYDLRGEFDESSK
jgi:ribosomal protein S12 methylthiotransferase